MDSGGRMMPRVLTNGKIKIGAYKIPNRKKALFMY